MSSSLLDITNYTSLSLLIRKRSILPSPSLEHLQVGPLLTSFNVTGSLFEPWELLICTFCLLLLVPLRFG